MSSLFKFAGLPEPKDEAAQAVVASMCERIVQLWMQDGGVMEKKQLVTRLEVEAKQGPAEVQEWLVEWKSLHLSRFMGAEVPCMLSQVHSGFGPELQVCAKREQDLEWGLEKGDVTCLKRHSGSMDTTPFDFIAPQKGAKEVQKLTDAANATQKRMKDDIGTWKQTVQKKREGVVALNIEKETAKLEKRRLEHQEEVSAASLKIEELTDKDAMKKAGGGKQVLVAAGVKGAERMDPDEVAKEVAKLKTQRFQRWEKVAVKAAESVLPDRGIQAKVQEVTEARAALQQLLETVTDQLTEQEKKAEGQRQEAKATVKLLEDARASLERQIEDCKDQEEDLIAEEAQARVKLEDLLKELPKAVEGFDKAKARRGLARVKIQDLQEDEEKLAERIKKVRVAADEADKDCEAWAMEAAAQCEELQNSIGKSVELLDAEALMAVQTAVANCETAAALLLRMIEDGELEARSLTEEVEAKQAKADMLEHMIDQEDCEDPEGLSEQYGGILDGVAELKKKLKECQLRLRSLRTKKCEADDRAKQLLSFGLPVKHDEAAKIGQEVVASAFPGRPLHRPHCRSRLDEQYLREQSLAAAAGGGGFDIQHHTLYLCGQPHAFFGSHFAPSSPQSCRSDIKKLAEEQYRKEQEMADKMAKAADFRSADEGDF